MPWEVEYTFREPIPVETARPGYPSISVSLRYGPDGRLTGLLQTIDAPAEAQDSEVIHESERSLALLLQIIELQYGLPITVASIHTSVKSTDGTALRPTRGSATASVGVVIASTVRLPADLALSGANPRFAALLYMFNAARRPTSDSEAVRLLYAIWEYLRSTPGSTPDPPEAMELKNARDFVSHGVKLDRNAQVVAAIEARLGEPIEAFDPQNRKHASYVLQARQSGEKFIGRKLELLL